jgi:hypothetical protein
MRPISHDNSLHGELFLKKIEVSSLEIHENLNESCANTFLHKPSTEFHGNPIVQFEDIHVHKQT